MNSAQKLQAKANRLSQTIDRNSWRWTFYETRDAYRRLDALNLQILRIENPAKAEEIEADYRAREHANESGWQI